MITTYALPTVDDALALAARGFHVFPLNAHDGAKCQCWNARCSSAGKHPRISDWQSRAAVHPIGVRVLWGSGHAGNIGAVPRRALVLDVDPRNGGHENALGVPLPETLRAYSGRGDGGFHAWYRLPDGSDLSFSGAIAAGVDAKANKGFVVMPPSLHKATGHPYVWDETYPTAVAPAWLIERVKAKTTPSRSVDPVRAIASAFLANADVEAARAMNRELGSPCDDALLEACLLRHHARRDGANGMVDYVVELLENAGIHVTSDPKGYRCRCPVHGGESDSSLLLSQGDRGVVAYCFGCRPRIVDIAAAAGIPAKAFFGYSKEHRDAVIRDVRSCLTKTST